MNEPEDFYNTLYITIGTWMLALRLLPILVGLWQWRQLNRPLHIFWFYLLALIGDNLLQQGFIWAVDTYTAAWLPYLEKFNIGNTNFMNIIGRIIDYIFLGWFYGYVLPDKWSVWVRWAARVLVILSLLVYIWVDGYTAYGNVNATLNRAFLIGVPMIHLWFLYQSMPALSLWKNAYFLISLGLLVANLFGLFLSFVGDKVNATDGVLFLQLSLLRNAFTIGSLFLFAYGFYQARYTRFLTKAA